MASLVALIDRPKDPAPAVAVLVAQAGFAPAEARMRLAPEPPAPVIRLEEPAATALAAALTKAGAPALAIDFERRQAPDVARNFELGPAQVTFFGRAGDEIEMGYGEIRLLLRGLRMTSSEVIKTETTRKFDLGKALLTQGLMNTKTVKREVRSEVKSAFHAAMVYGQRGSVLLDEAELVYQSLGPALKPSRVENLNTLVGELRKRASTARYDDRLLRMGTRPLALEPSDPFDVIAEILNQAQLLGRW
jgi:hypothetical protein